MNAACRLETMPAYYVAWLRERPTDWHHALTCALAAMARIKQGDRRA